MYTQPSPFKNYGNINPDLGRVPVFQMHNQLIHNPYFAARYFMSVVQPNEPQMEAKLLSEVDLLTPFLEERQQVADELQNEVNQLLASVLLWIRFAKTENKLMDDASIQHAEKNLQEAINRVRALHYALADNTDEIL